jgi:hypothetical protein
MELFRQTTTDKDEEEEAKSCGNTVEFVKIRQGEEQARLAQC